MEDLSADQVQSRNLLIKLIGMRLTEVFYAGNEIVLEFDGTYRLQLSPKGCEIRTRAGAPSLESEV